MLELNNIRLSFTRYEKGLFRKTTTLLKNLDLTVGKGQLTAVLGASGSGKSLLAHAILGILPENAQLSGDMLFKGTPLTSSRKEKIRGREIALIPQSVTFLDPLKQLGDQVRRGAVLSGLSKKSAVKRQQALFKKYQLPQSAERLYPFQLSGGMARRGLLAIATSGDADLLIADEPTPGLHPEILKETLNYLRELADKGKSILLITHELSGVVPMADKVAVFHSGMIVEEAFPGDFQGKGEKLRHPFTKALWQALPENTFSPGVKKNNTGKLPETACPFVGYCPENSEICIHEPPAYRETSGGRVRCHYA